MKSKTEMSWGMLWTESVMEIQLLELLMVWGNIECINRVGDVGQCNGECDGWSV